MSLYLKQQDTRSDLQEKISKDLQERARQKAKQLDRPDGVDDSRFVEGTKQTTSLAWAWVLIGLVIIGIVIWIIISLLS
ncbi:TPA: hypothetical protein DD425_01480 [Candidatus Saccharibacteria bacterium]|nr:hypothetical protein [Candidatus Saccharibacteria bacterium]|tara:strand:- start:238 stop:474 length:237 start_codon:yes stop_codon:yes gene_type:complete